MNRASTVAGLVWRPLVVAAILAQAAGCVTAPPPRGFDVRHLELVVSDIPPHLDVSGLPGGKAVGAGVGAGTGSGAGLLLGAAACAATGPFIGICIGAVVPATTVAGAITGGVVGAVKTESVEALQRKTRALQDELAAIAYARLLALRLQDELGIAPSAPVLAAPADATRDSAEPMPWQLDVALTEVGTEGKSEFALRLVTRISLRRADLAEPVWTVAKEVQSETELTTSAWLLADAGAMRSVLDRCIRQAAHELAVDLTRPVEGPALRSHPRSRRSSSCRDVPDQVLKATAS